MPRNYGFEQAEHLSANVAKFKIDENPRSSATVRPAAPLQKPAPDVKLASDPGKTPASGQPLLQAAMGGEWKSFDVQRILTGMTAT
jgi:hypothetical protein